MPQQIFVHTFSQRTV